MPPAVIARPCGSACGNRLPLARGRGAECAFLFEDRGPVTLIDLMRFAPTRRYMPASVAPAL